IPRPYPSSIASEGAPQLPPSSSRQLASVMGAVQKVAPLKMRWLDWLVGGAFAAAMAGFLIFHFAPTAGTTNARRSPQVDPISIAVLPFANLSGDASQEFFSDGMTEEITAVLAKIPSLSVVGRTSAFQFKGENKDLRAIGRALSATHLIEGS